MSEFTRIEILSMHLVGYERVIEQLTLAFNNLCETSCTSQTEIETKNYLKSRLDFLYTQWHQAYSDLQKFPHIIDLTRSPTQTNLEKV